MDIDIEGRIRSRIEAVLLNDARNSYELKMMASGEDPLDGEPFAEERNLYQRIINSYRNAVSEVNGLLEENIGFLSAFYRIAETIKEKDDLQDICSQLVDCILQDLGAEYCSVIFRDFDDQRAKPQYLEGIREQRKFLCSHSRPALLASSEFDRIVANLVSESTDCLNIGDVYREPRFFAVDFPSVVRSLVCLPIRLGQETIGALILSHSLPHYFTTNHTRVLKILASILAHLRLLTARAEKPPESSGYPPMRPSSAGESADILSIILLNFESDDRTCNHGPDKETIGSIRAALAGMLLERESLLLYDDAELLALLPGVTAEQVSSRISRFQQEFERWKARQGDRARHLSLRLGYSTCESGEDLARTLETASLIMRPDQYPGTADPAEAHAEPGR